MLCAHVTRNKCRLASFESRRHNLQKWNAWQGGDQSDVEGNARDERQVRVCGVGTCWLAVIAPPDTLRECLAAECPGAKLWSVRFRTMRNCEVSGFTPAKCSKCEMSDFELSKYARCDVSGFAPANVRFRFCLLYTSPSPRDS